MTLAGGALRGAGGAARILGCATLVAVWLTAGAAAAKAQAPSDAATAAVAATIAGRWDVHPADVRIEWQAGPAFPLAAEPRLLGSGAGGAFVAEVDGADGVVRRRLRAGVHVLLPVAARDIERGETLEPADVAPRDTVLSGPPRSDRGDPTGWVARRRITAGSPLVEPAVAPAPAVVSGQPVTVVWRSAGLEVKAVGVAAGTAAAGQRVAVRTDSGRRLWGVAEGVGHVRIEGGTHE